MAIRLNRGLQIVLAPFIIVLGLVFHPFRYEHGESVYQKLHRGESCIRCYLGFDDLRDIDFSNLDLTDSYFKNSNLIGVDLSNSNLAGVTFLSSNLTAAMLVNADLRGANFRGTHLLGADLSGTNLAHTNFERILYNEWTSWPENFDPPPSIDGYDHNP